MTWLKLDDGWVTHPKILSVSVDAGWFWLHCATYAAKHETDGHLGTGEIQAMHGLSRVRTPLRKCLDELLGAHLLDVASAGDGYRVHDFTDWNPCKSDRDDMRDKARDKKRKQRGTTDSVPGGQEGGLVRAHDARGSRPDPSLSLEISTTTSHSYPDEVVVVLNSILEAEYADQNPSAITRPDAWRAKVRTRLWNEWGDIFAEAFAAVPSFAETTLYDLASQVLDEHEHKLHYQILSRIADLEITCTPPKPNESAVDSKPSGPADDGPSRLSASGAGGSSATSSTPQNEPSSASVTDIASSRRSRSGGRPTEPSPAASSTPKPAQNGKDRPTVDEQSSPTSEPTSSVEHDLSVAASLGARLAKAGKPRHEVLELMSGFPDAEVAAAVDAWVAAMPERRRYENVVYQVDHVRPEDGQVFTVKVHQGGHVTGFRADFPADVWRSAEVVEA